ncbi:MAG: hypothetical protein QM537_02015 [Candidatus Symbiobacter sp.]|nr:hypothetical protein [Candidatus Symbiobacter sp.]
MSRLTDEIYETAVDLYQAGLMSEEKLRQFSAYDENNPPNKDAKRAAKERKKRERHYPPNYPWNTDSSSRVIPQEF